jgi:hypothetical protein
MNEFNHSLRFVLLSAVLACASVPARGEPQIQSPAVDKLKQQSQTQQILNPAVINSATRNQFLKLTFTTREIGASFSGKLAKTGQVKTSRATWNCNGVSCKTQTVYNATVDMCRDLVQVQRTRVTYFGYSQRKLTAKELEQCNQAMHRTMTLTTTMASAPVNTVVAPSGSGEEHKPGPSEYDVDIVSALIETNPRVEADFDQAIGWDYRIWADGANDKVYYYLPREYRIAMDDSGTGIALTFDYELASEQFGDKTVLMRAQLSPPRHEGDVALLAMLAKQAVKELGGNQDITLKPFPISTVKMQLATLFANWGIAQDDVSIGNVPDDVRDPITVLIRMSEDVKENLVTSLRSGEIGSMVQFESNNGYQAASQIYFSFSNLSGDALPTLGQIRTSGELINDTFFPVQVGGIVAYVQGADNQLARQYLPFKTPVALQPGQTRRFPYPAAQFPRPPVYGWFDYTMDATCNTCLSEVERKVLSMAGLTKRENLLVEALPALFERRDIAKVNVEIRSLYFDASGQVRETQIVRLYPDTPTGTLTLFLDRDKGADEPKYEYRVEAYLNSGEHVPFSDWQSSAGMDLTLTPADIPEPGAL